MVILWITNSILTKIAEAEHLPHWVNEGWLNGLSDALTENSKELSLHVAFPWKDKITGNLDGLSYSSYLPDGANSVQEQKRQFLELYEKVRPDVIHIMGSEYRHALTAVEAAEERNIRSRVVLSVQGLITACACHLLDGIPARYITFPTLRDIVRRDTLTVRKRRLEKRGIYEVQALRKLENVIGRTQWDHDCALLINPKLRYYSNNETLRREFYGRTWSYEACEKHTLFMSQANSPYKGFHYALRALNVVKAFYPDVKLYVASATDYPEKRKVPAARKTSYTRYITDLIQQYDLTDHIVFCGALPAEAMARQFLSSQIFLSCSAIENSPNSVGEAMLLGMPIISSDVGGVRSMVEDQTEAILYPHHEWYLLASHIMMLFQNPEQGIEMGKRARAHARKTHDPEKNREALLEIYEEIMESPDN